MQVVICDRHSATTIIVLRQKFVTCAKTIIVGNLITIFVDFAVLFLCHRPQLPPKSNMAAMKPEVTVAAVAQAQVAITGLLGFTG